jgi:hypothetical protein
MTQASPFHPIPSALKRILGASAVVLAACFYISGLQDQYAAPGAMTLSAVSQRVQPVSQVQLAANTGSVVQ